MVESSPFNKLFELSIEELEHVTEGLYKVDIDGLTVEALIQNLEQLSSGDRKLFVLLSGARDPERNPLPKFDRWKWRDKFNGVMLNISDPGLYEHGTRLRLGWYIGKRDKNYSKYIACFVERVAKILGVEKENIIFYGSSAGGFGSLSIGQYICGCKAIVINPQIDIREYIPNLYRTFVEKCYGLSSLDDISEQDVQRFDALRFLDRSKFSKLVYAQNIRDVVHLEKHYLRFCYEMNLPALGGVSGDGIFETYLYDSPNGHGAEPLSIVPELLQKVSGSQGLQKSVSQKKVPDSVKRSLRMSIKKHLSKFF